MNKDKVIVITGASSGAGRATALALAMEGAHLVLVARNEAALQELAAACAALDTEVLAVPTDVTETAAMRRLALQAFEWKGRIDVWVNNAGVLAAGAFDTTPWEVHEQVLRTNLMGYMHGAHAVLPFFKQQGHGILINNISIGGFLPVPYGSAYSASKYALRGFFEALKGELIGWPRIHVVDLFPPFLNTPGIQHAANYTGKVLRPAPPVYDTTLVATAVQAAIRCPRPTRYPGALPVLLKLAHSLAPQITVKTTARVISAYLRRADRIEKTDGNLFNTVDYGMATRGNASPRISPRRPACWVPACCW